MENNINQLIAKVLNRVASSEEIVSFSRWLSGEENSRDEFCRLKSYWDAEISFRHTLNPELSLQKTQQKIQLEQQGRKKKKRILYRLLIAASLIVLLGTGAYFLHVTDTKRIIPTEHYIYLTENNKTHFTLTDGTKIYLNKNSKLIHTNQYNDVNRFVKMEGEAYFEVRHNPEKPFVVEAGDARIKVVGTSFNVKIDGRSDIRTTLVEGSIRFEMPGQQVILTPNQQLLYTGSSHRIDISSIDIDKELAWMEGVIRHKNVLFSDLMDGLMKQFRVRIVINNEQLKKSSVSMTGAFAEDQSLEQILNVIAITYPFTWEKRESVYYIK